MIRINVIKNKINTGYLYLPLANENAKLSDIILREMFYYLKNNKSIKLQKQQMPFI